MNRRPLRGSTITCQLTVFWFQQIVRRTDRYLLLIHIISFYCILFRTHTRELIYTLYKIRKNLTVSLFKKMTVLKLDLFKKDNLRELDRHMSKQIL